MKPSELSSVLAATIKAKLPVLITGAPGVGKSDIVGQSAQAANNRLIIDHPAVSDPMDYKGALYMANAEANFLPIGNLREIVNATQPTTYFLDDLGQAPMSVQAAAMQLFQARRIGEHVVSDLVTFVAATNRRTDRAGVTGLLEPVKSRFATILNLEPDVDDWCKWALQAGLPTVLIAYIRFRPEMLHKFVPSADLVNTPSPRTVANIGRIMGLGLPAELEFEVFKGSAGETLASEFVGFLQIYRNLPSPDMVLLNPDASEVPSDPATLYALCGALVRKANDNTIDRLARYFNRMPKEFNVFGMTASATLEPRIKDTRAYIQWTVENQEVLI